jgi:hypothetical protein
MRAWLPERFRPHFLGGGEEAHAPPRPRRSYQADHGEVIYQVEEWSVTEILQVVALYSVRKRRQAPACAPYAACGAPPMRGMLWREGTR